MTIEKANAPGTNRGVQRSSSVVAADDGFSVTRPSYMTLAELVTESADRERAIAETMHAAGYRVGFEAGIEVGYLRAHHQIEAQQGRLHRELVDGVNAMDGIERARREPSRTGYCREDGCRALVSVPHRTRYELIFCLAHMPRRWCAEHRDSDACAFTAHQERTREPEYTGGPVSMEAWDRWAQAKQAGRGNAA